MDLKLSQRPDLTHGGIYQTLFRVAIPLIINNMIMSLYNLADGLWVAKLSMLDFTATSFVWPPNYFFISVGVGLSIAGTAIIAQLLGQQDYQRAQSYAGHLVLLSVAIGVVFSAVGYYSSPAIIRFMGATEELAEKSQTYLAILFLGFLFDITYLAFYAILGAQGKTKITTMISMISSITNVILDPFFIFDRTPFLHLPGLDLGIRGAAWATILAQMLKTILGLIVIQSAHNQVPIHLRSLRPEWGKFVELMRVGLPTALGQASAAIGFTLLNAVIVTYGEATMTAYAAVNRISSFLMMPAEGIGTALTAIIGQNMGAQLKDRVMAFVKGAFVVGLSMAIVGSLLQWFLRYPLISLFLSDDRTGIVWRQALEYNIYSLLFTPFMSFFYLFNGVFNGSGYHKYAAYMSIGRLWFIRLPLIYSFQKFTNMGAEAVWIAMLVSNILINVFGYGLYRGKKWYLDPQVRH